MSRVLIFAAVLAFSVSAGGLVFAHSGATGIVKERMALMERIADQMKTIGEMVQGKRPYDAEHASNAAQALKDHAGRINDLFPEGSNHSPSETLSTVWSDWEEFERLTAEFSIAADALSKSAASADEVTAMRSGFADVAKTCSECHQKFRKAR